MDFHALDRKRVKDDWSAVTVMLERYRRHVIAKNQTVSAITSPAQPDPVIVLLLFRLLYDRVVFNKTYCRSTALCL